jgi:hypothetical protein
MTETSPREDGDDKHNNQLGTKVVAKGRTVVATTTTTTMMAKGQHQQGAKRAMAMMAMTATAATLATTAMMMPTGNKDNKVKQQGQRELQ